MLQNAQNNRMVCNIKIHIFTYVREKNIIPTRAVTAQPSAYIFNAYNRFHFLPKKSISRSWFIGWQL